ncbi:LEC14B protein isoform X1 [Quercus robur]|uniref:LEC14B protein isoform X1 n=2 Tax=Quercus robur TaxID=38942 RepID=UPI002161B297|nr:LEC14B protein isoform X1 [Quercus robur]
MYVTHNRAAIDEMGYAMSRLEIEPDHCDGGEVVHGVGDSQRSNKPLNDLDNEIAQLTKLKSGPHQMLSQIAPGRRGLPVSTVKMLAGRECNFSGRGRFSSADCCHVLSRYLPVNGPWLIDEMNSRAYVSQFSADGSLFVAGFQGSHIRIYNVDKGWKVQKNILAKSLRWTITDTSLSPDQRHLVYASMSPIVHIVNVGSAETESLANVTEIHDGLDFSSVGDEDRGYSFGIFSVKFSTDGREVVAGSSDDSLYVYDLEANKPSLQISAHSSDVNTVCFADESGHLIYSGSDDTYCKVWDRRCLDARDKPAGVLMGHLEGITFIDSRGDGRYFISNGKDQSIKLWDIRKMSSEATCNREDFRKYEWDYRWMDYPPQAKDVKHPRDLSVATYRGHSVLRTLIRCYFSPEYSTGQKYIYTGSHNSCVYIYDLVSGAQVATLKHHKSPVRDCSWHPYYPMLLSSSWDGDIVKWEFPGSGEAPTPVTKKRVPRRYIY